MAVLVTPSVIAILQKYQAQAEQALDRFTGFSPLLNAFGALVTGLAAELMAELDGDPNTKGADKKAFILESAGKLFDLLVAAVPMPVWAKMVWPLLSPLLRQVAQNIAGGIVEWTLDKFRAGELNIAPAK